MEQNVSQSNGSIVPGSDSIDPTAQITTLIPLTSAQTTIIEGMLAKGANSSPTDPSWEAKWAAMDRNFLDSTAELLRKLKLDPTSGRPELSDYNAVDRIIGQALRLNDNGSLDALIIAACKAYTHLPEYDHGGWSHAVCHNFEKFNPKSPGSSLLSSPAHREAAETLIAEATKRALKQGIGCFDRTVGGVIKYAISLIQPENLDKPFPWKPSCLADDQVVALFGPKSVRGIFCASETPRQFIEGVAALVASSNEEIYGVDLSLELLEVARTEQNKAIIDACIFKEYRLEKCGISPAEVGEILRCRREASSNTEVTPGLFVDVDGTLVGRDYDSMVLTLTEVAKIIAALAPGSRTPITIFTGGDPEEATATLSGLGFPAALLPVKSKNDFRGKRLQCLIDDTQPDIQGFSADGFINPDYRFEKSWLAIDPLGALARFRKDREQAALKVASTPQAATESPGSGSAATRIRIGNHFHSLIPHDHSQAERAGWISRFWRRLFG